MSLKTQITGSENFVLTVCVENLLTELTEERHILSAHACPFEYFIAETGEIIQVQVIITRDKSKFINSYK